MQVSGDQLLEGILRLRPLQSQNTHVGNVKHADPFDGLVPGSGPRTARHLPAGEGHHASTALEAEVVERLLAWHRCSVVSAIL